MEAPPVPASSTCGRKVTQLETQTPSLLAISYIQLTKSNKPVPSHPKLSHPKIRVLSALCLCWAMRGSTRPRGLHDKHPLGINTHTYTHKTTTKQNKNECPFFLLHINVCIFCRHCSHNHTSPFQQQWKTPQLLLFFNVVCGFFLPWMWCQRTGICFKDRVELSALSVEIVELSSLSLQGKSFSGSVKIC